MRLVTTILQNKTKSEVEKVQTSVFVVCSVVFFFFVIKGPYASFLPRSAAAFSAAFSFCLRFFSFR